MHAALLPDAPRRPKHEDWDQTSQRLVVSSHWKIRPDSPRLPLHPIDRVPNLRQSPKSSGLASRFRQPRSSEVIPVAVRERTSPQLRHPIQWPLPEAPKLQTIDSHPDSNGSDPALDLLSKSAPIPTQVKAQSK